MRDWQVELGCAQNRWWETSALYSCSATDFLADKGCATALLSLLSVGIMIFFLHRTIRRTILKIFIYILKSSATLLLHLLIILMMILLSPRQIYCILCFLCFSKLLFIIRKVSQTLSICLPEVRCLIRWA